MLFFWVELGGITEFTIVILGVESGLSIFADLDEVADELSVGEILVEVILEVLNEIHVLLNKVVSSNSWEGESLIVELPSVNGKLWVLTEFLKLLIDFHGVVIVLSVESSGEVVQLNSELVLGELKTIVTTVLIEVDDITVWVKPELGLRNVGLLLELHSTGGCAQSGESNEGGSHIYL